MSYLKFKNREDGQVCINTKKISGFYKKNDVITYTVYGSYKKREVCFITDEEIANRVFTLLCDSFKFGDDCFFDIPKGIEEYLKHKTK